MPDELISARSIDWKSLLGELDVPLGGKALVAGPSAALDAECFARIGASAPTVVGSGLVALGDVPLDAGTATVTATGLEPGTLDLAILIHAWSGRRELQAVLVEANRIIRSGGMVVVAELELDVLRDSLPWQYPAALMYRMFPGTAEALEADCVDEAIVDLESVRAGFHHVLADRGDLTRGVFPDAKAHVEAIRSGLWRGYERLTDEQRAILLEAVAIAVTNDDWPLVDKEPWHVSRGYRL